MDTGPSCVRIMLGSGSSNDGFGWDANHHRMAVWDDHPACRSCMRKTGQTCSRAEPCGVCRSWPAELWVKVKQWELCSAKRRIDRAQAHLSGAKECYGIGQTSLLRIGDGTLVTPHVRRDPRIEAWPKDMAMPQIEAPSGNSTSFKILQLAPATSAANRRDEVRASQSGAGPRFEATKVDGESQLHRTLAKAGVHCASDWDGTWSSRSV